MIYTDSDKISSPIIINYKEYYGIDIEGNGNYHIQRKRVMKDSDTPLDIREEIIIQYFIFVGIDNASC